MPKKKQLALFIFVDSMGWEVVRGRSFMDDILVFKGPMGTVFGYSSTCDPTILTGKLPRDHGHFSFFRYNPKDSPFRVCRLLGLLPKAITRRGRVRQMMSRVIGRFYGITGYFQIYNMPFKYLPLFDYTEKRDIYQPGGINSGDKTVFDALEKDGIPFHVSNWRLPEEKRIEALERELPDKRLEFAYLFLGDIDAVMHEHGTEAPEVDAKVAWYDQRLRRLLDRVREYYEDVELYIFSDHGMTNVVEECDLQGKMEQLGLTFGKDFTAVYDSTMARFWFFNDGAKEKITRVLEAEEKGRILDPDTLADYGCDFDDHRYGELFFSLQPGVLLNPSFMGETRLGGMHGYDPYDKDSVASLMSNREIPQPPKRLEDLYPLMREAAGRAACG